jgi:hypothetical protein
MRPHLFGFLHGREDLMNCCKNVDNLTVEQDGYKTFVATCRKCGRRHRKMVAEAGHLGATLRSMGHG